MVKEILERLNPQYKEYLEDRQKVLSITNKPDDVKGEIRGYLKGLETCGIISRVEFRALYTYYALNNEGYWTEILHPYFIHDFACSICGNKNEEPTEICPRCRNEIKKIVWQTEPNII